VKEKISKEKGWDPATQKLIYSGMLYKVAEVAHKSLDDLYWYAR